MRSELLAEPRAQLAGDALGLAARVGHEEHDVARPDPALRGQRSELRLVEVLGQRPLDRGRAGRAAAPPADDHVR